MWILWLILAVCLMVAEIFTLGFFLFWFGIGALAAAIAGFLGFGMGWQFMAFAIVSIALTAMSRTILSKYLPHGKGNLTRTGVDSFPGKIGTVTASSEGALNEAAVRLLGSTWTAYPMPDQEPLTEGEKVEIVEVRGSSIYVRRVTDELPGWRGDN
jgi:membrane protein implicated in regulation of membrane protease activity